MEELAGVNQDIKRIFDFLNEIKLHKDEKSEMKKSLTRKYSEMKATSGLSEKEDYERHREEI